MQNQATQEFTLKEIQKYKGEWRYMAYIDKSNLQTSHSNSKGLADGRASRYQAPISKGKLCLFLMLC
jgi:hypothetical protein